MKNIILAVLPLLLFTTTAQSREITEEHANRVILEAVLSVTEATHTAAGRRLSAEKTKHESKQQPNSKPHNPMQINL